MEAFELYRKQEIKKIGRAVKDAFFYAGTGETDLMLLNLKRAKEILSGINIAVIQAKNQAKEDADYINTIK